METEIEAVIAAAKKYEEEHGPLPEIPDDVLTAWERPEVAGARRAFLDYVGEVTGGEVFPTNYYDKVLAGALVSLLRSGRLNQGVAEKLVHLYCAFVESLAPFQPSSEFIEALKSRSAIPWGTPPPKKGEVFYFVPGSGSYWIKGREAAAAIAQLMTTKPRAGPNKALNVLFQIVMVVIAFILFAHMWWRE